MARVREVGLSISSDVRAITAQFQLFEQRPIWTRVALLSQLTVEEAREVNKCVLSIAVWPVCLTRYKHEEYHPTMQLHLRYGALERHLYSVWI